MQKRLFLQNHELLLFYYRNQSKESKGLNDLNPKGTNTEWNSEPLKILKKLRVLSRNWTYDFKKDRNNLSYDRILNF